MTLVKATLKQNILDAFNAVSNDTEIDPTDAREKQASDIADAIDSYVKAGTVSVNVTVDPNSGIGTGTGNIS